ncbi:MAG: hypothetical protein R3B09_11670 [Nannocystaceae bacterium]
MTRTTLRLPLGAALGVLACTPPSIPLGDDSATMGVGGDVDDASSSGLGGGSGGSGDATTDDGSAPLVPEGVVIWSEIVPDVSGRDMVVAPDGSIYVVGVSRFDAVSGAELLGYFSNVWLGRFDPAGELLWAQEEEIFPFRVEPSAVDLAPDGSVYVTLLDASRYLDGRNSLRKYDADGALIASVPLPWQPHAVAATPDGGVVVGGSQTLGLGTGLGWARSYDPAGAFRGEFLWNPVEQMLWGSIRALDHQGEDVLVAGHVGTLGVREPLRALPGGDAGDPAQRRSEPALGERARRVSGRAAGRPHRERSGPGARRVQRRSRAGRGDGPRPLRALRPRPGAALPPSGAARGGRRGALGRGPEAAPGRTTILRARAPQRRYRRRPCDARTTP